MGERSSDGPSIKRVVCYALVEAADGITRVEPVVAHHMDEELNNAGGDLLSLASDFEASLSADVHGIYLNLGLSRYPPPSIGSTVRSDFQHRIVQATADRTLEEAMRDRGSAGYRAISTWVDANSRVAVLMEKAGPRHAAAT